MITLNTFFRRKPGLSFTEFRERFLGAHSELVRAQSTRLGLRKYLQAETLFDDPAYQAMVEGYRTQAEPYDGVGQVVFNCFEDIDQSLDSAAGERAWAELKASEAEFADHSRSLLYFSLQYPVHFTTTTYPATPATPYLKVYYVARKRPNLTREQSQFHWHHRHASIAQQHIHLSDLLRYIQAPLIDDPFAEDYKASVGGMEDAAAVIGHAEGWTERTRMDTQAAAGGEFAMAGAMATDDIKLFVDPEISQILTCKEHLIVDKPVITRPLVTFFGPRPLKPKR